ncbi:MAG: IS1 family transposase [Saprospiraceae bacterium]
MVFRQMNSGRSFKEGQQTLIWVAYDPVHRLVVAYHIGGRGTKAAKKFWDKIPPVLQGCNFETDDWDAYRSIIPCAQHKVGKDLTFYIEGFNATIRARVSRLVRKSLSFPNWTSGMTWQSVGSFGNSI